MGKAAFGTSSLSNGLLSLDNSFQFLSVLKMFNLNIYSHTGRVDRKQSLKEGVGGT